MKKRVICLLLSFFICAGLLPVTVLAEEVATMEGTIMEEEAANLVDQEESIMEGSLEKNGITFATETITLSDLELPDHDELYEGYLETMFYGENEISLFGIEAGEKLEGDEREVYKKLAPYLKKVADGESEYAFYSFGQEFTWGDTGEECWIDEEMTFSGSGSDFDLNLFLDALLADMPYELYWFNKSAEGAISMRYITEDSSGNLGDDPDDKLYWVEFYFTVAEPYQNENLEDSTFHVDTNKTERASKALATAEEIIQKYEDKSDYDKIIGYQQEIMDLTEYDYDAAENTETVIDRNPWQLLYVFDGDDNTNVVCEGYSKAFQYLMDESTFESTETKSYLVSGYMGAIGTGETGEFSVDRHMWNIVTLNGKNYLMDVTNSEQDTIGHDGSLTLAGAKDGSAEEGYYFSADEGWTDAYYEYYEEMHTLWGNDILTLASVSFDPDEEILGTILPKPNLVQLTEDTVFDHVTYPKNYVYYTDLPGEDIKTKVSIYDSEGNLFYEYYQSNFRKVLDEYGFIDMGIFADGNMKTGYYTIKVQYLPYKYSADTEGSVSTKTIKYAHPKDQYETPIATWVGEDLEVTLPEIDDYSWAALEMAYFTEDGEKEITYWFEGNIDTILDDFADNFAELKEEAAAEGYRGGTYKYRVRVASWNVYEKYHSDWSEWAVYNPCSTGHIEVIDKGKEATCTSTGLTEGKHCFVCGTVIVKQTVIPAKGHTEVITPAVEATCTSTGLTEGKYCTVCGEVTVTQKIVPESHTIVSGICTNCKVYGTCGNKLTWTFDVESGTLRINGNGSMSSNPWIAEHSAAIKEVVVSEGVTTIVDYAFNNCSSLSRVTLPKGLTVIGNSAFNSCRSLSSIEIPGGVTTIGEYAFARCSSLNDIEIPKGVTTIGDYTFSGCSSLSSIEIPEGVTMIGDFAFNYCSSLNSITLPEGLTTIGISTFYRCSSLSNITLPEGLTTIGNSAFYDCSSLSSITLPVSLTSISDYSFVYCSDLTNVYYNGTEEEWNRISIGSNNGYLTNAIIHFLGYSDNERHIEVITPAVEATCTSTGLTEGKHCSVCGAVIVKQAVIPAKGHTEVIDPAVEATCTATGLTEGKHCTVCGEVTVAQTVVPKSHTIVSGICTNCKVYGTCGSQLTWIFDVENGVLRINGSGSMSSRPWIAEHSADIKEVVLSEGVTTICDSAFLACRSLSSIEIPEGVTTIGDSAFHYCSNLSSIEIPEGVTTIGYATFSSCRSLSSIELPEGLTTIGDTAFNDCSTLSSIEIPEGVTTIGDYAFNYCSTLSSIEIPEGVTAIGDYAFRSCTSLSSIELPEGLTTIGSYTFSGCSSMSSITLPASLTSISDGSFYYCRNLTDVYYNGTEEEWNKISIGSNNEYLTKATIHFRCIDGKDHIEVTDAAVEATCTETGLSEGKHCSVCGTVTVEQTVVPAKGHTEVIDAAVEATCTSTGLTEGKHCSVCGAVIVKQAVIPAKGHTEVIDPAVEATCTATGLTEGKHCTVCGEVTVEQTVIPSKGHTEVIDEGKEATCTSTGLTEGKHCTVCGEVTVEQTVIPAKGHTVVSGVCTNCKVYGTCGDELIWTFDVENGILRINGNGSMASNPWIKDYRANIKEVILTEGVTSIAYSAFNGCTSLSSVELPEGLTTIGSGAFNGCTSLSSVELPEGLTTIGSGAFYDCTSLSSIKLPEGLKAIGSGAFDGCTSLSSIELPEGLIKIADGTFFRCTTLSSVKLPEGLTMIGSAAFEECTTLSSIKLPEGLTMIDECAFRSCGALSSITLPASLTSIKDYSFDYCSNLTDVYYNGTEEEWNKISIGSYNEYLTKATIHFLGDSCAEGHTYAKTTFSWKEDLSAATLSINCFCGYAAEEACTLSWDNSQKGKLVVTAAAKYNGELISETKEITASVNNDQVIVELPVKNPVMQIIAAAYNDAGKMVACMIPQSVSETVTLDISGNEIRIFFVTDGMNPVSPILKV